MLGRMEDDTLARWNALLPEAAAQAMLPCCGSRAWARAMAARRPLASAGDVLALSGAVWRDLRPEDWDEAFASHPRIGEAKPALEAGAQSLAWSAREQGAARASATPDADRALAEANRRYEARFGRVFLICASGRTAAEMLAELEARMGNDAATELAIAAEEQRRITDLRLARWLREGAF